MKKPPVKCRGLDSPYTQPSDPFKYYNLRNYLHLEAFDCFLDDRQGSNWVNTGDEERTPLVKSFPVNAVFNCLDHHWQYPQCTHLH